MTVLGTCGFFKGAKIFLGFFRIMVRLDSGRFSANADEEKGCLFMDFPTWSGGLDNCGGSSHSERARLQTIRMTPSRSNVFSL